MKQPGQWTGTRWVCPDQPADEVKRFYYCCPDGYKTISKKGVQAAGTNWQNITTTKMVCSNNDVMACGPKPTGDVVCCPSCMPGSQIGGQKAVPWFKLVKGQTRHF